jgi:ankyrin repeat protein
VTALYLAAANGNGPMIRALLERGVNRCPPLQLTSLMIAAETDATDAVRMLLEHKADIHARTRAGAVPARRMPCVGRTGCGSHGKGIVRGGLPDQATSLRSPAT